MAKPVIAIDWDDTDFVKKNADFVNDINENGLKFMKLSARIHAAQAFRWTLPISSGQGNTEAMWPVHKIKDRTAGDVRNTFFVAGDAGWARKAYTLIKDKRGVALANAWWSQYWKVEENGGQNPSGKTAEEEARRLLSRTGSATYKDSEYQALRKTHGFSSLGKDAGPLAMLKNKGIQNRIIAKRQKRAGLAKAAWRKAVEKMAGGGGKSGRFTGMRSSRLSKAGFRSIEFPKDSMTPIKAMKGKNMGSANAYYFGEKGGWEVSNDVPYVDDLTDKLHMADAGAQRAIDHIVRSRLKRLGKKFSKGPKKAA